MSTKKKVEQAIKKAIEGGYKGIRTIGWFPTRPNIIENKEYQTVFLDPLFWQALGKAEGWAKFYIIPVKYISNNKSDYGKEVALKTKFQQKIGWEFNWHRFIDHLIQGKDINSFFEELLKENA